jgi:antitoxin VapB
MRDLSILRPYGTGGPSEARRKMLSPALPILGVEVSELPRDMPEMSGIGEPAEGRRWPLLGRLLPMGLNIKNERVHQLAREAASRTGLSQTSVIETALLQYLRSLDDDKDAKRRRVDEILAMFDAHLTDEDRAAMGRDLDDLYDEAGLPR